MTEAHQGEEQMGTGRGKQHQVGKRDDTMNRWTIRYGEQEGVIASSDEMGTRGTDGERRVEDRPERQEGRALRY